MDSRTNHPSHYAWLKEACGVEPNEILRHFSYNIGAAMKYLIRAGRKTEQGYSDKEKEIEDLKKAVWYINDQITYLENE